MKKNLHNAREDYQQDKLEEHQAGMDPFGLFHQWIDEAEAGGIPDFNAFVLSTSSNNQPHSRIVLLKELDDKGFVFYTNYQSQKASEMEANGLVALNFWFREHERQVRVEGKVEKVDAYTSDTYFANRPRGSQIGAWASPQSQPLAGRAELEALAQEAEQKFEGQEVVARPPHWGGYRVVPVKMEFWQGRSSRLHDRLLFVLQKEQWTRTRLAP